MESFGYLVWAFVVIAVAIGIFTMPFFRRWAISVRSDDACRGFARTAFQVDEAARAARAPIEELIRVLKALLLYPTIPAYRLTISAPARRCAQR
jgi:hypothetical protein